MHPEAGEYPVSRLVYNVHRQGAAHAGQKLPWIT